MNGIETIFLVSAAMGGLVLVLQTVLSLFGGDHGDVHHDVGGGGDSHDAGMNLISIRSISAFLAAFGLAGWGTTHAGWSVLASLGVALLAGAVMLVAVALLFRIPSQMYGQGNLEPAGAVGKVASVYLRIPGANSGKGKITLSLQGRSAEFHAFTHGPDIPTGAEVRIVRLVTDDTFEVQSLS